MSSATPDVRERLEFAARVAREAGHRILRYYGDEAHLLKDGGSPVTVADIDANTYLVRSISAAYPGEPVLAEESPDSSGRQGADRLWVVDPLDGTREFLARNGEFSVMIGFVSGGEPTAGVVYLPARRLLYGAALAQGAWAEGEGGQRRRLRCVPADRARLRMVESRSHRDPLLSGMQEALHISDVLAAGSVGIKCAMIAEGTRDLYIHPVAHLKEWDTCAPEVVLREAGGKVTDCLGAPLRYNKPEPVQPHGILACGAGLHAEVLRVIAPLYESALGGERIPASG